jgi:hypothetical protein
MMRIAVIQTNGGGDEGIQPMPPNGIHWRNAVG